MNSVSDAASAAVTSGGWDKKRPNQSAPVSAASGFENGNAAVAANDLPRPSGSGLQETSCDDARLVKDCLAGDEQAWATLIEKYKRLIYSIPIKYGTKSADAADIFQAVCVDLFCDLGNLRKVQSLKAWIVVVTSHKCFQWKKQQRAEMGLEDVEEVGAEAISAPAPDLVEEVEQEQSLREAVAQLSSRCRELVRLLFYHHPPLPYAEVARRLGLATGSIGFIRGRCLDRLQKTLREKGFR